ncbi:MAG: hypothetical protein WCF36_02975 [Candidatus Nanopelagicales bacterium]
MADDQGLPICLTFPCAPAPGARAVRHRVDIDVGWSVDTGHDEALERIAAALGGGASCMDALRAVLPGLRTWWQRARRETGSLIHSPDRAATWVSSEGTQRCCPAHGFVHPQQAAEHTRSVPHVAAVTGVAVRDLRAAVTGLGPVAQRAGSPPEPVDQLTAQAWECGLHPDWVAQVRTALAAEVRPAGAGPTGGPVSLGLLLAIWQTGADPKWLIRHQVDDDTRQWLAWTATDLDAEHPQAREAWLATGARRSDVVVLSEAGYQAHTAIQIAGTWRMSVPGTAKVMARWSELGYRPTAEQFGSVAGLGVGYPPGPPAVSAVERVAHALGAKRPTPAQRTAWAMDLIRCGTVPDTVAMLRASRRAGSAQSSAHPGAGVHRPPVRASADVRPRG